MADKILQIDPRTGLIIRTVDEKPVNLGDRIAFYWRKAINLTDQQVTDINKHHYMFDIIKGFKEEHLAEYAVNFKIFVDMHQRAISASTAMAAVVTPNLFIDLQIQAVEKNNEREDVPLDTKYIANMKIRIEGEVRSAMSHFATEIEEKNALDEFDEFGIEPDCDTPYDVNDLGLLLPSPPEFHARDAVTGELL